MAAYKIVGESKPNKIKLLSSINKSIVEMSKRSARKMLENGIIKITNPEQLYLHL